MPVSVPVPLVVIVVVAVAVAVSVPVVVVVPVPVLDATSLPASPIFSGTSAAPPSRAIRPCESLLQPRPKKPAAKQPSQRRGNTDIEIVNRDVFMGYSPATLEAHPKLVRQKSILRKTT